VAALVFSTFASAAWAHTSYLMPSTFSTADREVVTIEASFGEVLFFRPEVAVDSADFHVLRPDGRRDVFDRTETFRQLTLLESDLSEPGTYRFTTGERLGRVATQVQVEGQWRPLAPGATAPAGAPTQRSQTATVAEVYVTKGATTRAAVDAPGGRLAFQPVTHPNAVYAEDGFVFDLRFDGAPLADQVIEVDREGGALEEPRFHQTIRTDAQGRATLRFDRPGVYLIMTRHRAPAPPGAETPIRSYTTSLTFEVTH
jgi:uncharacterized GH25 family protein